MIEGLLSARINDNSLLYLNKWKDALGIVVPEAHVGVAAHL